MQFFEIFPGGSRPPDPSPHRGSATAPSPEPPLHSPSAASCYGPRLRRPLAQPLPSQFLKSRTATDLHRLKTYFRNTTGEDRLTSLALLTIHHTTEIDIVTQLLIVLLENHDACNFCIVTSVKYLDIPHCHYQSTSTIRNMYVTINQCVHNNYNKAFICVHIMQ